MKFDVYGRFRLEVAREGERWVVYRLAPGKRIRADDVIIPPEIPPSDIGTYLDDLFHEASTPGKSFRQLP
jgi:hypothetical protein